MQDGNTDSEANSNKVEKKPQYKIVTLKWLDVTSEDLVTMFNLFLEEGLAHVNYVRSSGFPPRDIKVIDDLDGPLYVCTVSGDIVGAVRTFCPNRAWKKSLNNFSIPAYANPFGSQSVFEKGLEEDDKGTTRVTKDMKVEEINYELFHSQKLEIQIRA